MQQFNYLKILCSALFALSSCSLAGQKEGDIDSLNTQLKVSQHAASLSPEENKAVVKELGKNFVYGEGLGSAILNVGTTVVFPPYGLFLLGNLALEVSGYEPMGVGAFLEGDNKQSWKRSVSSVVSGPGRVAAAVAGQEYRNNEIAKKKIEKYISLGNTDPINDDY